MENQCTSDAVVESTPAKGPLVLLIEDNDDHAELVRRAMLMCGRPHEFVRFEDGEEALRYLLSTHTNEPPRARCALILLDLRLPRMDGLEVLRSLRQSKKPLIAPVVILTTSEAHADIAAAYEHGAHAYVVKPRDFKSFGDLARELSAFWLGWNRSPAPG